MTNQEYLLIQLCQECCEVGKLATKALHFGLKEIEPGKEEANEERLAYELSDLFAVVEMLIDIGIDLHLNRKDMDNKKQKVSKYMGYSKYCDILEVDIE